MQFNNEAKATTYRLNEQRKKFWQNFFGYKIADVWNTLKPCDVLWIRDWIWFACELKFLNVKKDLTYDMVLKKCQRQQLLTLESYYRAWWHALIIGYNKWTEKFYQFNYQPHG